MLKETLLEDLKQAMKEKDEIRKNTIQMVRAAILQVEKDKSITIEDDKIIEIIAKESKKKKRFSTRLWKKWKKRFNCTNKTRNRDISKIFTKTIIKRRNNTNCRRSNNKNKCYFY